MSEASRKFQTAHQLMRESSGCDRLRKAADLMKQAADLGHAGAANNFGAMLQYGRGVDLDLEASRAYYAKAAQSGLPAGLFNFGFMLLNGLGGSKDAAGARHHR